MNEHRGKKIRANTNFPFQIGDPEESPFGDLLRIQTERSVGFPKIDPDKLVAGFSLRVELADRPKRNRVGETEFLAELSPGGLLVGLPRVEMAAAGRIPNPGIEILRKRAFLQKDLSSRIEEERVNRAVAQSVPVNTRTGLLSDDAVCGIHNIEKLRETVQPFTLSSAVPSFHAPFSPSRQDPPLGRPGFCFLRFPEGRMSACLSFAKIAILIGKALDSTALFQAP